VVAAVAASGVAFLSLSLLQLPSNVADAASAPRPTLGGCTVFPASNAWNKDISKAKVNPKSAQWVASVGLNGNLHADFGSDPSYGIPYQVVPSTQPKVRITYTAYGEESDKGPFPIPAKAKVEAGGDGHVLVLQKGSCKLYELYNARKSGAGWKADSGAVFDLKSNKLRPAGWTSADAAGLPVLPGLVRPDEIAKGFIDHALRFTVSRTQRGWIPPARHFASSSTNANLPPMGARFRLKASFSLKGYHGDALIILKALKKYGMIVADNGSNWFISGATWPGWNDDDLNQLKHVPGAAFEVVQTGAVHR
jgi:hypothetical protein